MVGHSVESRKFVRSITKERTVSQNIGERRFPENPKFVVFFFDGDVEVKKVDFQTSYFYVESYSRVNLR